jgi:hypothetical protein
MKKTKKLTRGFFERPTLKVAKDLLGKYLVRVWRGKKVIGLKNLSRPGRESELITPADIGPRNRGDFG